MTSATPAKPGFARYAAKALTAAAGFAAILLSSGQLDGRTEAIVSTVVALAATFGVYQIPNKRAGYVGEHRAEA
jgi:hypothetical protein